MLDALPADHVAPPIAAAPARDEPIGHHVQVVEAMQRGVETEGWPETFREWGVGLAPSGIAPSECLFPHWDHIGTLTACKVG